MNESKMMKKEGRGMAKADMQKVAKKEVKGHEMKMHGVKKLAKGGGIEKKGKTRGKIVKMADGGLPEQAAARAMSRGAGMGNAGGAMRGLDRAAAMSGRTMPVTGRPVGMKKGGKLCK